mmetsp:Transcript_24587/g.57066  ORF Transcript_24587/g.57066 Transcript_24587/m.57066 type:complete len:315 (-) Transcript_24587:157-1101(-)
MPDFSHLQGVQASQGAVGSGGAPSLVSTGAQKTASGVLEANLQLRRENERLRGKSTQLAAEIEKQRHESLIREARWQEERKVLKQEDLTLRGLLAKASWEASVGRRSAAFLGNREAQKVGKQDVLAISAALALGCACMVYCCFPVDEGDQDDEENLYAAMLPTSVSVGSCLRCFCRPLVCSFICGTLVVTFVLCCVLWEIGLLQPVLAQCMVYVYVVGVIGLFISLLVYEVWVLVVRSVRVVLGKVNHPLVKAVKAKHDLFHKHHWLSWCDDGAVNAVVETDPGHIGSTFPDRHDLPRLDMPPRRPKRSGHPAF